MTILEILIVGIALSMDAFAVTITNLIAYPHLSRARCLAQPVTFGVFQGLMVLIGYYAGSLATTYLELYAGPVALVILAVIGGRMIYGAIRDMREKQRQEEAPPDPASKEHPAVADEPNVTSETSEIDSALAAEPSQATSAGAPKEEATTLTFAALLFQGVATSLDALIVGVSFAALGINIILASPLIGITTLLICVIGLAIGRRVGILLGDRAQLIGGIILILIGIKACFF